MAEGDWRLLRGRDGARTGGIGRRVKGEEEVTIAWFPFRPVRSSKDLKLRPGLWDGASPLHPFPRSRRTHRKESGMVAPEPLPISPSKYLGTRRVLGACAGVFAASLAIAGATATPAVAATTTYAMTDLGSLG